MQNNNKIKIFSTQKPCYRMSGLQKLVQILKKFPNSPQKTVRKQPVYKHYLTKQQINAIKRKAARQFRAPWRGNSIQQRMTKYKAIRGKCLSNWQIDRILISDRSFSKNLKSVKVPAACNQFHKISAKDGSGHLPYLYESQLPRIKKIQSQLYKQSFKPTSQTIELFGLKKTISQSKSLSSRILQKREFWIE